jgi:hypothetical protein
VPEINLRFAKLILGATLPQIFSVIGAIVLFAMGHIVAAFLVVPFSVLFSYGCSWFFVYDIVQGEGEQGKKLRANRGSHFLTGYFVSSPAAISLWLFSSGHLFLGTLFLILSIVLLCLIFLFCRYVSLNNFQLSMVSDQLLDKCG